MRVRGLGLVLALMTASLSVHGDVRLAVKRDGSKVIYNVGGGPAAKGTNWDWFAKRHDRRSKYDPIIERYADRYGVDPVLVRAVIQVESDFNPRCLSNKGARGLMQLIPATARRFGVKDAFDPEENIHGGVKYLAFLIRLFNDDLTRALAAYNAGEGAVKRYGGIPPYEETTVYVKRALTVYYGKPYGGGSITFAGKRGKARLRGGFGALPVRPTPAARPAVAASMLPTVKYLGTH